MVPTTRQASDAGSTSSALFTPISHRLLWSVNPKNVSLFLKEIERYVDVASYKMSVDRGMLRTV